MTLSPESIVADLAARMRLRIDTACGEGTMPWRIWGDGAPLVLLHGGSGSWTHWLRNIDALAVHYCVIVPDLPGLGDAASLPAPYTAQQAAQVLNDGLDVVLADPRIKQRSTSSAAAVAPSMAAAPTATAAQFHLAAFSWGCTLAGQVADWRGAQLHSLALIGPAAIGPFPLAKMQPLRKRWRDIGMAELREISRYNLQQLMLHDPDKIDDLAIHLQIENTNRTRFNSPQFARSELLLEALARTRVPLSVIYGERDGPVYPHVEDRRTRLLRARPDMEFQMVPDVGHWAQFEWPGYNDYLLAWLGRHACA